MLPRLFLVIYLVKYEKKRTNNKLQPKVISEYIIENCNNFRTNFLKKEMCKIKISIVTEKEAQSLYNGNLIDPGNTISTI